MFMSSLKSLEAVSAVVVAVVHMYICFPVLANLVALLVKTRLLFRP
jgi:hypothetical protein